MIDFDKTIRINMLLDFYSALLTKKQLDYMLLYFKDDLSLQEIANLYQVSRNAIYDNIQRTIKQLNKYEEKLQLFNKFTRKQEILDQMKIDFSSNSQLIQYIYQLEELE
ncbi:YlxM family DNA-binding protein [Mycoplasmatota bacterium]|nr:YlxM family DNA-binding protein [Mycoplasmatota bacterium]